MILCQRLAAPCPGATLGSVNARAVLDELVSAAALPPVISTRALNGQGFDNQLLVGLLSDGHEVLLRQSSVPAPSPVARASFLATHGVGAPRLYAANQTGAVLVDYIEGETLAAAARRGGLGAREWQLVGEAYRRIHAVQFPAGLRGSFGPERLELTPTDPVHLMHSNVDAAEPEIRALRPSMLPHLSTLRHQIDAHAEQLRRETTCLTHADPNFHNLILATDRVTLIDWDYPAVRYPLEELEALEEHAYLNGVAELPDAFFAGYGRQVPRALLRLHRLTGCIGHVGSREWADMAADSRNPPELRSMISTWDERLKNWIYQIENHLKVLA